MDSWTELLERSGKLGATSRKENPADPPLIMDANAISQGRPIRKGYYTWKDVFMIALSIVCFFLAVLTVVYAPFAVQLTQKNQLIIIGFLLSLMAACLQKQAQLLLITLEARFGASTLQNYDSILRSSMLDVNVSVVVKISLMLLFALPLGLSAAYKQFVSGSTTIEMGPMVLDFGPVGPPGLVNGAVALTLNASLPVLRVNLDDTIDGDFWVLGAQGFNTAVISKNMTAMLDAPLPNNLTHLQHRTLDGESLWISAYVNATICTLNSTTDSPDRADPDYWSRINATFTDPPSIANYNTGLLFGMVSGYADATLSFMSLWDTKRNETFTEKAMGFNLYRGQCNATWQISRTGVTLEYAYDCTPAPLFVRPCNGDYPLTAANYTNVTGGQDLMQLPLTCNMMGLSQGFVWPFFNMLANQAVAPVWVTAMASAVWSMIVADHGPTDWALNMPDNESAWEDGYDFPFLKYKAPVTVFKQVQTLHQSRWPLYFVLGIQPVLLLVCFFVRVGLYATPVSSGFGLIALLAGCSKDGVEVLRGAAFSGELKRPVRMRISTIQGDGAGDDGATSVKYELDAMGRHGRVEKGMVYG